MPLTDYSTGTLCWAKLKGYPWWPARIEDEQALTPAVRRAKPKSSRTHPVFYFGSLDYSWVSEDCLESYHENYERFTGKQRGKRDPQFTQALAQAKDPVVLEKALKKREQRAKSFEVESDEESDREISEVDSANEEEEEEDEQVSPAPKTTRGKKRTNGGSTTPKSPNKRQAVGARKASSAKTVRQTANFSSETPNNKGRRGAVTTSRKRKTNGVDEGVEPESPTIYRSGGATLPLGANHDSGPLNESEHDKGSFTDDNSSITTAAEKPSLPKSDNPYISELRTKLRHRSLRDCLMFYRHKIQKTLLKDQNPDDLAYIDAVFHEMELVSVDLVLLKETKVFKLMKRVVQTIKIDPDHYHLRDRALALVHKWRQEYPELVNRENRDSGTPVPTSTGALLAQQENSGAGQDQSVPSSASPTTAAFQHPTSPSEDNNAVPHSGEPETNNAVRKSVADVSDKPVSPTVQGVSAPTLPYGGDKATSPEHHAAHVEPSQPSAISS
ncbi:hypothetical protein IWQ61_001644 [Dispira simplex]|nr:hypothetical protein IWQ61_001644 [Dispira simplex]